MPRSVPIKNPSNAGVVALPAIRALQTLILDYYATGRRDLPWRDTTDPYHILVAEVMLQQTQVPRVIPKYVAFVERFPSLPDLAAAPTGAVLRLWSGLGYNNRAVRLQECAQVLVERTPHDPHLPTQLAGLERLPGIGPYTARAVLIFATNAELAAVDANVRRVLTHELDLAPDLSPAALQVVAETVLPRGRARDWHNALMDYGSAVLTARATGISPRSRQSAFLHSRRWYRARVVRLLVEHDRRELGQVARELGLSAGQIETIVALLERDGLVCREGAIVRLA